MSGIPLLQLMDFYCGIESRLPQNWVTRESSGTPSKAYNPALLPFQSRIEVQGILIAQLSANFGMEEITSCLENISRYK